MNVLAASHDTPHAHHLLMMLLLVAICGIINLTFKKDL